MKYQRFLSYLEIGALFPSKNYPCPMLHTIGKIRTDATTNGTTLRRYAIVV